MRDSRINRWCRCSRGICHINACIQKSHMGPLVLKPPMQVNCFQPSVHSEITKSTFSTIAPPGDFESLIVITAINCSVLKPVYHSSISCFTEQIIINLKKHLKLFNFPCNDVAALHAHIRFVLFQICGALNIMSLIYMYARV